MSWLYLVGQVIVRTMLFLLTRYQVYGRENVPRQGAVLIVSNHIELPDVPLLAVSLGRRLTFMAKKELFRLRLIGRFIGSLGAFPVHRGQLDRDALRQAERVLAEGSALAIFPEGKRSKTAQLQPAFPGSALIALRSGAPILPVGITGTEQLRGATWWLRRPRITVNIGSPFRLPPISTRPTKVELAKITNQIMEHIAELLPIEYRGDYLKSGKPEGLKVEKAAGIGFCFGVKRAVDLLEKISRQRGRVETLGAVVHNKQVMQRLAGIGVSVADSIDNMQGDTVAIGTHGVIPQIEEELRAKYREVINTTCPFVHRAQVAARRLARSGFWVIIYGDADHPEVKGILGWASGKGIATLDEKFLTTLKPLPRRLGILSQTTQIPARFNEFVKKLIDSALTKDAELRIIDTICHDIRERQQAALELTKKVDLMLVIGSHTSANTKHLAELCAAACPTYLVETAEEIQDSWLQDHHYIGITSGASTSQETIDEVLAKLESATS